MLISERIFAILDEQSISQKDFAKRTNIAESTISDWKRKKLNPSADKIPVIASALGVSINALFGIEETSYDITVDEEESLIINAYRNSDEMVRYRMMSYIRGLINSNSSPISTITNSTDLIDTNSSINSDNSQAQSADSPNNELIICKNLVRRLRKLARLDRIRLDESNHSSGLNKHLFSYFDYIGIDKLDFIKEYLCHLQPFMVSEIRSQETFDNAICVIDEYYRISVYIKVDASKGEEVIVSFHENNKNGIAKRSSIKQIMTDVYVFADSIGSHLIGSNNYTINLHIMRGVRSFPICIAAHKYDDEGFLVNFRDINNELINIANQYLEDLYTSDIDFNNIEIFSSLQQLSFTSYGNDVFSNISLLIDSLIIQKDSISRQIADSALCIYCNSIQLSESDKADLLDTLSQRFLVNSVRIMPAILLRIEQHLPPVS